VSGARWDGLRRAFRLPARREAALDAELRFHLEERVDELVAGGMSRESAEREVRRRFGNIDALRQEVRAIDVDIDRAERRAALWDTMRRETRQAVRGLLRSRAFAPVVVGTLALGLGATIAIFTVLDAVVLRPLPYPDAERLVFVSHRAPGLGSDRPWGVSVAGYFEYLDQVRELEDAGVYNLSRFNLDRRDGGAAERVQGATITASVFSTLGLRAAQGRLFTADEDRRNGPRVVVVSHELWQRSFGSDPALLGRTIDVHGVPTEVVGIMAPGGGLPDQPVDLWIPYGLDRTAPAVNSHYLSMVARVRPGAGVEAARAGFLRVMRTFPDRFPGAYSPAFMTEARFAVVVESLRDRVVGDMARALWVLFAGVGLVLLIAVANAANLFLVRLETRRREQAVRTALGAERAHLAWHAFAESGVVAMAAWGLAMALAWAGLRVLLAAAPAQLPRLAEVALDWRGALLGAVLAAATAAVFGVMPVLRPVRDLTALREQTRGLTPGRRRHAVRGAFVVAQVALALVLLASAGLMVRSVRELRAVHPGLDAADVLTFDVALPMRRYETNDAAHAFHRELATRIGALPGVVAVGATGALPFAGNNGCSAIYVEDRPLAPGEEPPCLLTTIAAPGYFRAMGIPLSGEELSWEASASRPAAIVISKALAERYWPGADPIGKGLRMNGRAQAGGAYYRVIGVTGDVRADGLDKPAVEGAYFPILPIEGAPIWMRPQNMTIVVRTRGVATTSLLPAIRREVAAIDAGVPIASVRTMEEVIARSTARSTFTMLLLSLAAGMALMLSAVGIYGVISYLVGERRGEIGIRMALGARAGQVSGQIVWESVRLALVGVAVGVVGALAATRLLGALLYGVSPGDPLTLGTVAAFLLALVAVASWGPARRAARVQPVEALRG
jgi:putative ABC transport system permease protein